MVALATIKYIALLFFAFTLTAILCFVEGVCIIPKLIHQFNSQKYPSVIGHITHSQVEQQISETDGLAGVSCVVDVGYQYIVKNQKYVGNCFRYNNLTLWVNSLGSSSAIANSEWAKSKVAACRVGSAIDVFYNPNDPSDALLVPGMNGDDVLVVLGLSPFNMAILSLWIICFRGRRQLCSEPIDSGVITFKVKNTIRARLNKFSPTLVAIGAIFGLSFIALFFVKRSNLGGHPSFDSAIFALCSVYGIGLVVFFYGWWKVSSGDYDLIINETERTICLPKTLFGKARVTIAFADISAVMIKVLKKPDQNGDFYCYAPTLQFKSSGLMEYRLASWRDRERADIFVAWLRKELDLY